jgi:hypothetical protein
MAWTSNEAAGFGVTPGGGGEVIRLTRRLYWVVPVIYCTTNSVKGTNPSEGKGEPTSREGSETEQRVARAGVEVVLVPVWCLQAKVEHAAQRVERK